MEMEERYQDFPLSPDCLPRHWHACLPARPTVRRLRFSPTLEVRNIVLGMFFFNTLELQWRFF